MVGNRLFVAPRDHSGVIALEADTGNMLWESVLTPSDQILGLAGTTLVTRAGEKLAGIDAESGHDLWTQTVDPLTGAPALLDGTNVFVLFDTSNFMYKGFVYAEDAIADFVRGLDRADSIAVYTFSRNLSRAAPLTHDHSNAIAGLRKSVAGDDTALYNALLLALRDAAKVPGRKVIIVFSNGPDNASMVAPDDVRAVADDEGIPLYVISTAEVNKDPISSNVFKRISQRTGGKAYFAKTWQKQVEAFEDIREDLGNSYTVTYYPKPNPNEGFRKITIDPTNDPGKKWRIRSRPGYRPSRVL